MNANDYPYSMEPMSQYQMVRDWLEQFGKPLDQPYDIKLTRLASACITEEAYEVDKELSYNPNVYNKIDKPALTKELCDLLWVTYQAAAFFGLPIEAAFQRVYESNMSKLGEDGKPVLREDGKILKSKNYIPPDLSDLFE